MTNRKNREPAQERHHELRPAGGRPFRHPAAVSSLALGALLLHATTPAAAQTDTTAYHRARVRFGMRRI